MTDNGAMVVHNCGFGMGDVKFRTRCDEVADIQLSKEMAKHVIKTYRKKYESVTKLWSNLEKVAQQAITNPGKVTAYKGIKYTMKYLKRRSGTVFPILMCRYPSGHTVGYPRPQVKMTTTSWGTEKPEITYEGYDSYTHKWTRLKTYGGKLTENVTQGVAYDLIAFGMLLLEQADYQLVMSIHDETIGEDDEDFGSLEDFELLLCTQPAWSEGIPVDSEGWQGMRYKK